MARQRRTHERSPSRPRPLAPAARPAATLPYRSRLFRSAASRRWWRLSLALLLPICLLAAAEAALRLIGYGDPLAFFVPLGPTNEQFLTTNRRFASRFLDANRAPQPYPVHFPARKPPGTHRIFVLGESAALGTPAPAFGFARILEVMLAEQFPERRFDVINAAMRGINSHVIRPIARECSQYQPDLFLIYMGNNEAVGLHAPEPGTFNLARHPRWIQTLHAARQTRLAQLILQLAPGPNASTAREEQDMNFFRARRMLPHDPERQPVYTNYRRNLERILQSIRQANAQAVLATVAVNLADFPPLGSLHRPDLDPATLARWEIAFAQGTNAISRDQFLEAIPHFQAALALDDHHAELHFRLAQACAASLQPDLAATHFSRARDLDALSFRTDARLNAITREVALANPSKVHLVDAEAIFAANAGGTARAPGQNAFHDHVHLTFSGDYLLAQSFLPAVIKALNLEPQAPATSPNHPPLPALATCAEHLAFTEWDNISTTAAMIRSQSKPPFLDQVGHADRQVRRQSRVRQRIQLFQQTNGLSRALQLYEHALARRPGDWQIHLNHGTLQSDFGNPAGAARAFAEAARIMPGFVPLRLLLVKALWEAGDPQTARRELEVALSLDPQSATVQDARRALTRRASPQQ